MNTSFNHYTVLKNETISNIIPSETLLENLKKNAVKSINIIDATLGGGGHAEALIQSLIASNKFTSFVINLIMFDQDINAIEFAKNRLDIYEKNHANIKLFYENTNFSQVTEILNCKFPLQKIHALYADFGVSSPQLDNGERGFSLINSGPLDMRMNPNATTTAKEILENYSEEQLIKILFDFGEEPKARKLAKAIVIDRKNGLLPLNNTVLFADYVKRVLAYPNSRMHPATRTFQALRIEVNQELEAIQTLLQDVPKFMHPYGKAGFISFHSLEDRLVKHAMRNWQKGKNANEKHNNLKDLQLPLHMQLHIEENQHRSFGKETPRGGIVASEAECKENHRSRSARFRCFEFSNVIED